MLKFGKQGAERWGQRKTKATWMSEFVGRDQLIKRTDYFRMTMLNAKAGGNCLENSSCSEARSFPPPTGFCPAITRVVKMNSAPHRRRQPIECCLVGIRNCHLKVGVPSARQPYANRPLAINKASDITTVSSGESQNRHLPFSVSGRNKSTHSAGGFQAVGSSHVFGERNSRKQFVATPTSLLDGRPECDFSAPPSITALFLICPSTFTAPSLSRACAINLASRAFPHTGNPTVSQQDCQPPASGHGLIQGRGGGRGHV